MKLSLPIEACNKLNANTIDLFALVIYLHRLWALWIEASMCLDEMWHKLRTQMFVQWLTWNFGQNIHFLSRVMLEVDEVYAWCSCWRWWSNTLWGKGRRSILGACVLSFQQLLLKLSIHVLSIPRKLLMKVCYYYASHFKNLKWLFRNQILYASFSFIIGPSIFFHLLYITFWWMNSNFILFLGVLKFAWISIIPIKVVMPNVR